METPSMPNRFTRLLLSGFVVLNLVTVGWSNMPESAGKSFYQWVDQTLSPHNAYRLKSASWRWQQYAHFAGLDNRWQMFGRQSRFNWWYDIRAIYSDGEREHTILLPLPNQSARTYAQRMLFDLKERKFELNLYRNPVAREAYSRYLARQFPWKDGMPIQRIRWHLGSQAILPPAEAIASRTLHSSRVQVTPLDDFDVRCELAQPIEGTPKTHSTTAIAIEKSR